MAVERTVFHDLDSLHVCDGSQIAYTVLIGESAACPHDLSTNQSYGHRLVDRYAYKSRIEAERDEEVKIVKTAVNNDTNDGGGLQFHELW